MKINTQPIEKRTSVPQTIHVHSIFETIQGEGPFCGTPCVFVRLAGCNLQCPGCDTDYTSKRKLYMPLDVLEHVQSLRKSGLVVITGGEPFRQNLTLLIRQLTDSGYYIQIETNGTLDPPIGLLYNHAAEQRRGVYVVVSPKTGKVPSLIWKVACCAKYVLSANSIRKEDGLPITALGHSANPYIARPPEWFRLPVYLQPMDEQDEKRNLNNTNAVLKSCMKHGYILQLQIHKLIGVA